MDALDIVVLKLGLVSHDEVVSAIKVLYKFVIKGLARDLDADAQDYLYINTLLFQCRVQDAEMALARFFNRVILLVLRRHDLV